MKRRATKTTMKKEAKMIDFVKKNTVDNTCKEIAAQIKEQYKKNNISEIEIKKVLDLIKNTERLKSVLPYL